MYVVILIVRVVVSSRVVDRIGLLPRIYQERVIRGNISYVQQSDK